MDVTKQFDFGENWKNFSRDIGSRELENAMTSIDSLLGGESVKGKTFLDVGCGSGLFSIAALKLGAAKVLGIDVNVKCIETAKENLKKFDGQKASFRQLSILDKKNIQNMDPSDVVYAWGSLHHTGHMYEAIENTLSLVAPGGIFVIAIYNRSFSSKIWWYIKWLYNLDSVFLKSLIKGWYFFSVMPLKVIFYPKTFLNRERGMNNYYDAIDWLGGFPYEYASKSEISDFVTERGFKLINYLPTKGLTGCNQFVFCKSSAQA